MHELEGYASRGKARRVDPQTSRMVGAPTCAQEQRRRLGCADVSASEPDAWTVLGLRRD